MHPGVQQHRPKVNGGTGRAIIIRAAGMSCILATVRCCIEHLKNISLIPYNHPELDS